MTASNGSTPKPGRLLGTGIRQPCKGCSVLTARSLVAHQERIRPVADHVWFGVNAPSSHRCSGTVGWVTGSISQSNHSDLLWLKALLDTLVTK